MANGGGATEAYTSCEEYLETQIFTDHHTLEIRVRSLISQGKKIFAGKLIPAEIETTVKI